VIGSDRIGSDRIGSVYECAKGFESRGQDLTRLLSLHHTSHITHHTFNAAAKIIGSSTGCLAGGTTGTTEQPRGKSPCRYSRKPIQHIVGANIMDFKGNSRSRSRSRDRQQESNGGHSAADARMPTRDDRNGSDGGNNLYITNLSFQV
jgi:hypothetical protein